MEVSSVKPSVSTVHQQKDNSVSTGQKNAQVVGDAQNSIASQKSMSDSTDQKAVQKPTIQEEVNKINKALQELFDTDIQFSLHEETKTLMVQVVDLKDKKVIKEFPPHEFLDTMARIREYIGILLDARV